MVAGRMHNYSAKRNLGKISSRSLTCKTYLEPEYLVLTAVAHINILRITKVQVLILRALTTQVDPLTSV